MSAPKDYWADDGKEHQPKCAGAIPCTGMRLALKDSDGRRGLVWSLCFYGKSFVRLLVYKKAAGDGGCKVRFCPFCGVEVQP